MTKKTISELPSIGTTQSSTALVAIEQDSITSNAPVRPNPPNQRNYTTQAQIEADFTGLIIDEDNLTFFIDDSFELTLPIQIATGISLEIKSGVSDAVITYSGTGAVIRNEIAANLIGGLKITDVDFVGDDTNDFIDVDLTTFQSVNFEGLNFTDFNNLGTIRAPIIFTDGISATDFKQGFKLENYQLCDLNIVIGNQTDTSPNPTFLSFIPDTTFGGRATIDAATLGNFTSDEQALLFFDPNSVGISTYQVTNSLITTLSGAVDFYQQGTDIVLTVSDGAPNAIFTTSVSDNGLSIGDIITISGYTSNTDYNGTFTVTAATATTFETGVAFGSIEVGGVLENRSVAVLSTAIGTSGSGFTNFTTEVAHGLVVGKVIVNSGFSDTINNGTFVVVSVDVDLTGTVYELEVLFDSSTDTGTMNAASLDSTSTIVNALNNPVADDSMFIGESGLEIFGSEDSSSSLVQNAFEVVTNVSWLSTNLERFSDGVADTGQLVCNDPKVRRYKVSYSGTIEKSGGGSVNIGIIILKNSINVAFNPPHTVNIGKIQISGNDIIELTATDTLDVAVINYDSTAAIIDTSQLSLVVSL